MQAASADILKACPFWMPLRVSCSGKLLRLQLPQASWLELVAWVNMASKLVLHFSFGRWTLVLNRFLMPAASFLSQGDSQRSAWPSCIKFCPVNVHTVCMRPSHPHKALPLACPLRVQGYSQRGAWNLGTCITSDQAVQELRAGALW